MNKLQIFKFQNTKFTVVLINGEPHWIAKEICDFLEIKNSRDAVSKLKESIQKKSLDRVQFEAVGLTDTLDNRVNSINLLTEAGLYKLVFKSNKPEAEKFSDWVSEDVLPSIRRHGAYLTDEKIEEVLTNPDTIIKLATQLKKERAEKKHLELQNKQKDQLIGELKPKADYLDSILKNKGLVTITQIAKDYGMSGTKLNELLHEYGVQYKQSGQWLLYSKHHGKGYTHSETIPIKHKDGTPDITMNTKWTQKGRLFLYELLKEKGLLPIIEITESEIACDDEKRR